MTKRPFWLLLAIVAGSCGGSSAAPDSGTDAPTCVGPNPALACRAAPDDCIPSVCACSASGWACTADCGGGRACDDGGGDAGGDGGNDGDAGDGGSDAGGEGGNDGDAGDGRSDGGDAGDGGSDGDARDRCEATGGTVRAAQCCQATTDFPSTCSVGACGCAPENSHPVVVCACPADSCFVPERGCVVPACTPGADQTCNDDPAISSLYGHCLFDHTCACGAGSSLNPATGKCR